MLQKPIKEILMRKRNSTQSNTSSNSEKTCLQLLNLEQLASIAGGPMAIIRKEG